MFTLLEKISLYIAKYKKRSISERRGCGRAGTGDEVGKAVVKGNKRKYLEPVSPLAEKVMAPHSSTLAWKIPRTEEPGGLPSMGS